MMKTESINAKEFWHGNDEDRKIERDRKRAHYANRDEAEDRVRVTHKKRDPNTGNLVPIEEDIPSSLSVDPVVMVKSIGGQNTYGDSQDMTNEHGNEVYWSEFANNSNLSPEQLSEILDQIVQGKSYQNGQVSVQPVQESDTGRNSVISKIVQELVPFYSIFPLGQMDANNDIIELAAKYGIKADDSFIAAVRQAFNNFKIQENASMGAVGAGAVSGSGDALGRKTTTAGSIFTGGRPIQEKKSVEQKLGKKWGKAMQKGDSKKAQSITDKVKGKLDEAGILDKASQHLQNAKSKVSGVIGGAVDKARDKVISNMPTMDINKVPTDARAVPGLSQGVDDFLGKMAWGALGVKAAKNPDGSYTLTSGTSRAIDDRLLARIHAVTTHLDMDYQISDDHRTVTVSEKGATDEPEMEVHEGMFDLTALPSKGSKVFGTQASKKTGVGLAVPKVEKVKEERVGPNAKREVAAMRSPTTPNKKMQQFVGEMKRVVSEMVAPAGSPMERLATSLATRIAKRFGGSVGVGGEWRWSQTNYAVPIVIHPDVGGAWTLIVSAFADNSYTYRWYTGRHGLSVSEMDAPEGINGQQLYGGTKGGVDVMLRDIENNIAEIGRRWEQNSAGMTESHKINDFISWDSNGILYEGTIRSIYGHRAVVELGTGGLSSILGSGTKVSVDLRGLTEAKAGDNYHSVFVQDDKGKFSHHFDADSHADAQDEMRSLRTQGDKPVKLVVPKGEANWNKIDVHDYVTKRLAQKKRKA